jgi:hypothetical protein
MDPATLATIAGSAVALLSPYLKKTAQEIEQTVGSIAVKKVEELLSAIKAKFQKNASAQGSLNDLAKSPDDTENQAAVREYLKKMLSSDEDFANQLTNILKEAANAGADKVFNTTIYGDVQKLTQIGHVNGDVNIS